MIRLSTPRTAAVIAALSLLPVAALAQTSPPAAAPAVAPPTAPATPGAKSGLPKDAAAQVQQHNKELHDQLGITPQQQPQWDQFTQVTRDNAEDMQQAFADRGAKIATMNAAENMQSYAALAQVHAANMQKLATAFQSLYSTLTPEQKQTADRLFRNRTERAVAKH
jgi:protein CpxP